MVNKKSEMYLGTVQWFWVWDARAEMFEKRFEDQSF